MKKCIIYFVFLNILITSNIFAQGFNSVFSPGGNIVIAVGNSGIEYRSIDGGTTLSAKSLGTNNLYSVYGINMNVWIAAQNGIYSSTDEGLTFNFTTDNGVTFKSIYFIDNNTGWAAGNSGTIKMTTNGGTTWSIQVSGTTNELNSIKFSNSSMGIACGNAGTLIYTSNGGSTWNSANSLTSKNLLSIDFKGTIAYATGEDAFILKSTNSGLNWSYIDYKILTKSQVKGVSIIDQNTFYSCGGGGFIRKSIDGGNTFSFQMNPMMADLSSIYFLDSSNGWAVSSKNFALMHTSDGGNNWSLPAGTNVTFHWDQVLTSNGNIGNTFAPHPKNKNGLFVVGGDQVFRSLDLGQTWTQISTINILGNAHAFIVNSRDTNVFLAAIGETGGKVVKSTDYGLTWNTVWGPGNLSDFGVPMVVDPSLTYTVYLAPIARPLLRSTDFGSTWANWSTTTFVDPCDLAVVYKNSGLMYFGDQGGGGKFYKSTDGGINWNLMINAGGAELPMIGENNLDNNRLFFTNWGGSGLWRSTNAGINWSVVSPTSTAWGADIAKDDPTVIGFGTWGGNSAFISTDGGDNFLAQTIPNVNYGVYFYDRGTLLLQQGSGVFRLNVDYQVLVSTPKISNQVPQKFELLQNFPNPFNPGTIIGYQLPKDNFVKLIVYDILGKEIAVLVNEKQQAGEYNVRFDGNNFSSGVYFYKLEAGDFIESKKMLMIK